MPVCRDRSADLGDVQESVIAAELQSETAFDTRAGDELTEMIGREPYPSPIPGNDLNIPFGPLVQSDKLVGGY